MLRGETVTIYTPTVTYDEAMDEVAEYTPTVVGNVLFGRPTTEQTDEAMRLYGVRAQYTLGIPKTYTASLRGCYVVRGAAEEPDATDDASAANETSGTAETDETAETVEAESTGTAETTDTEDDADEGTEQRFWIAGDPQPLPPEICPTPWNREAIAGWVDG